MTITTKYDLGQIVYLITDDQQLDRIVTGMSIRMGSVIYELSCGSNTSSHYDFEMASEKDIKKMFQQ